MRLISEKKYYEQLNNWLSSMNSEEEGRATLSSLNKDQIIQLFVHTTGFKIKGVNLENCKNVVEFGELFQGLEDAFKTAHYDAILIYTGIIPSEPENKFWEIYLIKDSGKVKGMCGLYSLKENDNSELWLGWFGILPEFRNEGIGTKVLKKLKHIAKQEGAHTLMCYVDEDGAPLNFYYRNNFVYVNSVKKYVKKNNLSMDDFESPKDHVISCIL